MESSIEIVGKILLQFRIAIAQNIFNSQSSSNSAALLSSMDSTLSHISVLRTFMNTEWYVFERPRTWHAKASRYDAYAICRKENKFRDCNPIADIAGGAISDCECKIAICDFQSDCSQPCIPHHHSGGVILANTELQSSAMNEAGKVHCYV